MAERRRARDEGLGVRGSWRAVLQALPVSAPGRSPRPVAQCPGSGCLWSLVPELWLVLHWSLVIDSDSSPPLLELEGQA